jgi:hypothetical protein
MSENQQPEARPLPGKSPKFSAPNLTEIIGQRIEDPGAARIHYGLAKNPTDKFLTSQADALKAAQRELTDFFEGLDLRPYLDDAAAQQIGFDKIELLRKRVRAPKDAAIGELILAVLEGRWTRNTILMCPMNRPIEPWVHWAQIALLRRQPWLGYDQISFTSIPYARNLLVKNFLATEAEWSFWLDSDTVPPLNDPGASYSRFGAREDLCKPEFFRVHASDKLQSCQKTIVGGIVPDRRPGNKMIIQPDLNPRNEADKELVRALKKTGPQNKVIQVDYVGAGCLMVHRSVYEDIMKKRPELASPDPKEPFGFFNYTQSEKGQFYGEDIAFSRLAAECGHPSFLDLSVWCSHVGPHAYFTQPEI